MVFYHGHFLVNFGRSFLDYRSTMVVDSLIRSGGCLVPKPQVSDFSCRYSSETALVLYWVRGWHSNHSTFKVTTAHSGVRRHHKVQASYFGEPLGAQTRVFWEIMEAYDTVEPTRNWTEWNTTVPSISLLNTLKLDVFYWWKNGSVLFWTHLLHTVK